MSSRQASPEAFINGYVCYGSPPEFVRATIFVKDGIISDVDLSNRTISQFLNVPSIDCSNYVVTPGFINAHIHPNQLLNRTMLDGINNYELLDAMHNRHEKKTNDDRYWASLVSVAEALECGTSFLWAFGSGTSRIVEAMERGGVRGAFTIAMKDTWMGRKLAFELNSINEITQALEKTIQEWKFEQITPVLSPRRAWGQAERALTSREDLEYLGSG